MKRNQYPFPSTLARLVVPGLLAMALWTLVAPAARAGTRTVCASGCDYTTIQAAINASTAGDVISVLNAVHTEAGITVKKNLTIRGQGVANTIVQAQTSPNSAAHRVFTINIGVTATIQDMTVRYGNVAGGIAEGGGVYNNGTLTLHQVTMTANRAAGAAGEAGEAAYGGAIYNAGTLAVRSCTITANRAQGGNASGGFANAGNAYGGGIYNSGALIIENSTISGNTAQGGNATAEYGGGGDAYGGGLYNQGELTVQNSALSDNAARAGIAEGPSGYSGDAYGGGIVERLFAAEAVTFSGTTISGNTAEGGNSGAETGEAGGAYGGGIAQWWSGTGTLALANCTVSGNSARGGESFGGDLVGGAEGGGLRGSGGLVLSYCTVASNQTVGIGTVGAGVRSYAGAGGGPVLQSSILADNSGPLNANGPDLSGNARSQDYNLIENPNGFVLSGTTGHNVTGLDPLLGPLQDNGGATRTHALQKGSPSINRIPNGKVGCGTTVTEDQRGATRPQDLACDIGAFELVRTGLLEVVKDLEPDTDAGRFHLQIDGVTVRADASDGSSTGKLKLTVGVHTVDEIAGSDTLLANYSSGIECRDGGGQGSVVASSGNAGPLNVTVGEDQDIVCTIRNVRFGTVLVTKQTDPGADLTTFAFSGVVSGNLTDGETLTKQVLPGTYAVQEAVATGWDLGRIRCFDADSTGDVEARTATYRVAAGETVKCIFTNIKRGLVIVAKQAQPDADPATFSFSGAVSGSVRNGQTLEQAVAPGMYHVREAVSAGWDLKEIRCDDTDSSGDLGTGVATYRVEAGETVRCAFTNIKRGTLVLEKQTEPDGEPSSFTFSGDVSGVVKDGQTLTREVVPGTYSVQEAVLAGWDLRQIQCSDPTGDSVGDVGTGAATYRVGAGETVRCVFTNTKRGTVMVEKQTEPDGDLASFTFSGLVSGGLKDGQTLTKEVAPGTYTVQEASLAGWDLREIRCDDTDSSGAIDTKSATYRIGAGETVKCTFTNTKRGSVTIRKDARPDGTWLFSFTGDLGAFSLRDDGINSSDMTFSNLLPGRYNVAERALSSWRLTGLTCLDADDGTSVDLGTAKAVIDLDPGEEITCTFENTKGGTIIVEKQTQPAGVADVFTFSGDVAGSISDGGQIAVSELQPGVYTSREAVPSGWVLASIQCSDPSGNSTGDAGLQTATFRLDPGEIIQCTFHNSRPADLAIDKSLTTAQILRGQPITYILAFSNTAGVLAPAVVIQDEMPTILADVRVESNRLITATGVLSYTWQIGNLAPGEGDVITVTGVLDTPRVPRATFTNTVTISGSVLETKQANNSDLVRTTVIDYPPVGVQDAYRTGQNEPHVSAPSGVLDNDRDPEGDPLLAKLVAGPKNGVVLLNLDGTLVYTPNAEFSGVDTFTYAANDGLQDSEATNVTITVVQPLHWVYLPMVLRRHP